MSNLSDIFEQDSSALTVKNSELDSVGALAKRSKTLEKEINELKDTLKEIKAFYGASIKDENRAQAYEWLRANGFDDIIKNTVSVRFGRGEDELCDTLLNILREKNYPVEQAQKVEPQTLKAWVREMVERGNVFPTNLFGAYIGQKATIKTA